MKIDNVNNNNNDNAALLQKWQINDDGGLLQVDDNFDNNENKIYLLLIRIRLVGHMLDHVIIGFVTTKLHFFNLLAVLHSNQLNCKVLNDKIVFSNLFDALFSK